MKYLAVFSCVLFSCCVSGQSRYEDSLQQLVSLHRGDTSEMNALIRLGQSAASTDFQKSFSYLKAALRLANKVDVKARATIFYEMGHLHHRLGQYDSSLFYHRQAIAAPGSSTALKAKAWSGISLTFLWQLQFDSAKANLNKAQTIAEENKHHSILADIYNSRGNLFLKEGNTSEALKQYILTAQLQDSLVHDPLGSATALANIGNIQYIMGNFDKGLDYIKEAQAIAQAKDLKKVLAYTSQQLGRIYRKQGKLNEALLEYKKALTVYLRMGEKRSAAETYSSIGNIYFDMVKFDEAQKHYKIAIQLAKEISNDPLLGMVYSAVGNVFHELKQYDRALIYIDSALTIGRRVNDQYLILDAHDLLVGIYQNQHRYKEALEHFQQFSDLKDSLNTAESRSEVEELEMKYQNEKKLAEIESLKARQVIQELELKRERANVGIIALALASVIVIGFLLINRYRVINRSKRQMELERMRSTIAQDLHDDIGSTLSSINIISRLALKQADGNSENYFQRINEQSSKIMESISDIVWSINPNNDSMEQMVMKMKEFALEILEPRNIAFDFLGEEKAKELTLDLSKRKNLFLLFKEAINNAAKHSGATTVTVTFTRQGSSLQLVITDNGIGFNPNSVRKGNGQHNLRDRAIAAGGSLTIDSTHGEGTTLVLTLALP